EEAGALERSAGSRHKPPRFLGAPRGESGLGRVESCDCSVDCHPNSVAAGGGRLEERETVVERAAGGGGPALDAVRTRTEVRRACQLAYAPHLSGERLELVPPSLVEQQLGLRELEQWQVLRPRVVLEHLFESLAGRLRLALQEQRSQDQRRQRGRDTLPTSLFDIVNLREQVLRLLSVAARLVHEHRRGPRRREAGGERLAALAEAADDGSEVVQPC